MAIIENRGIEGAAKADQREVRHADVRLGISGQRRGRSCRREARLEERGPIAFLLPPKNILGGPTLSRSHRRRYCLRDWRRQPDSRDQYRRMRAGVDPDLLSA